MNASIYIHIFSDQIKWNLHIWFNSKQTHHKWQLSFQEYFQQKSLEQGLQNSALFRRYEGPKTCSSELCCAFKKGKERVEQSKRSMKTRNRARAARPRVSLATTSSSPTLISPSCPSVCLWLWRWGRVIEPLGGWSSRWGAGLVVHACVWVVHASPCSMGMGCACVAMLCVHVWVVHAPPCPVLKNSGKSAALWSFSGGSKPRRSSWNRRKRGLKKFWSS